MEPADAGYIGLDPRTIDIHGLKHLPCPARVPFEVGDSILYPMRRVADARGGLTVREVLTEVPFAPATYFSACDVESLESDSEAMPAVFERW